MKTPACILVVSTLAYTTEAFLLPYIRQLKEMGYPVEVLANWKESWNRMPPDILQHHFPFCRNLFNPINLFLLFRLVIMLRKNQYSLIYTHTPIASALIRIAKWISISPVPILYEVHGFHFHQYGHPILNKIYRWLEIGLSRNTQGIITINTNDFQQAKHLMTHPVIYYSPGIGIDPEYYRAEAFDRVSLREAYQISASIPVMITIADFIPRKKLDQVIRCGQVLKDQNTEFLWLLIGRGPQEESLKLQIEEAGLGLNFRLTGWQIDVRPYLALSDIFVLLSIQEGLPRSLLEAGLMKKPCVVSNIRGNRDVVDHGKNSYLVPADQPLKSVNCLQELIQNPDKAAQMGQALQHKISQSFSYHQTLEIHRRIFHDYLTF